VFVNIVFSDKDNILIRNLGSSPFSYLSRMLFRVWVRVRFRFRVLGLVLGLGLGLGLSHSRILARCENGLDLKFASIEGI